MEQHSSCLVIGGGIAGLMAAAVLQQQGITTTVVDKGFGIGGRLASRSVKTADGLQGYFDYGSQFFSGSTSQFQAWLHDWIALGLVQLWADGFVDSQGRWQGSDRPLYRGTASTRSVAQHLAQAMDVRHQTRIERLTGQEGNHWMATAADGQKFYSDAVILTAPVPQALELLASSALVSQSGQWQQLHQVTYDRCMALLVLLERESLIPPPGGLFVRSEAIAWMASNSQKGISPDGYSVTIHATPGFSLTHWDDDSEAIARHLYTAADPWLGSAILAYHLHRWKYSQPTSLYPEAFAVLNLDPLSPTGPLILAGDGFAVAAAETSVERAALSGQAAAQHLLG